MTNANSNAWAVDDVALNGAHVLADSQSDISKLKLNADCTALSRNSTDQPGSRSRNPKYYFHKAVFTAFAKNFEAKLATPLNIVRTRFFPNPFCQSPSDFDF